MKKSLLLTGSLILTTATALAANPQSKSWPYDSSQFAAQVAEIKITAPSKPNVSCSDVNGKFGGLQQGALGHITGYEYVSFPGEQTSIGYFPPDVNASIRIVQEGAKPQITKQDFNVATLQILKRTPEKTVKREGYPGDLFKQFTYVTRLTFLKTDEDGRSVWGRAKTISFACEENKLIEKPLTLASLAKARSSIVANIDGYRKLNEFVKLNAADPGKYEVTGCFEGRSEKEINDAKKLVVDFTQSKAAPALENGLMNRIDGYLASLIRAAGGPKQVTGRKFDSVVEGIAAEVGDCDLRAGVIDGECHVLGQSEGSVHSNVKLAADGSILSVSTNGRWYCPSDHE